MFAAMKQARNSVKEARADWQSLRAADASAVRRAARAHLSAIATGAVWSRAGGVPDAHDTCNGKISAPAIYELSTHTPIQKLHSGVASALCAWVHVAQVVAKSTHRVVVRAGHSHVKVLAFEPNRVPSTPNSAQRWIAGLGGGLLGEDVQLGRAHL